MLFEVTKLRSFYVIQGNTVRLHDDVIDYPGRLHHDDVMEYPVRLHHDDIVDYPGRLLGSFTVTIHSH